MVDVDETRRASFGRSVLVAMSWYVAVIAAVLVRLSRLPATPSRDCGVEFCFTPLEGMVLLAFLAAPIIGALVAVTLAVAGMLARRLSSSIVTGTLSAVASVGVVAALAALWHAVR